MQEKNKIKYAFDIISIGDATIDTFLFVKDISVAVIGQETIASFPWGSKIPVDELHKTVAGNALNAAIASKRLGLNSAFYTILGEDSGGREILHKLKKEKVNLDYVYNLKHAKTNASTVLSKKGERTIFVYHVDRQYKLPALKSSKMVYLTSMGKGFESIYHDLVKYVKKNNSKLIFNPGTFQLRSGVKKHHDILQNTHILSLNVEEAEMWSGIQFTGKNYFELAKKLLKLGPKIILITDGRNGSYAFTKDEVISNVLEYYCRIFPGKRIEATGAGDSFTTAFTAAIFYNKNIQTALKWGSANAASVVGAIGPITGQLTKAQLLRAIASKN